MAPSFTPREDPSKTTNIGRSLNQAQQDELIKFLIDNLDILI
jgi:hypothetical protein